MSKITKFFDVYGMKCHSCEAVVEEEIEPRAPTIPPIIV